MKTKKALCILIGILFLTTAIFAVLHLSSRQQFPEGSLAVNYQGTTQYTDIGSLSLQSISGTVRNAKGEEKQTQAMGIEIASLLKNLGINPENLSTVTVTADDEFSASITREELLESEKVFLYQEETDLILVVFGDEDSKRNVRNVVRLDVS